MKLIRAHHDQLYYQHDYSGGFDQYRHAQIRANKSKLDWIWADERTLSAIAADLDRHKLRKGVCHGARNGFEVKWFASRLNSEVIGTDISETAAQFPNMVVHDFHEPRDGWEGRFDFIYTNSLDQAFDPKRALDVWAEQLAPHGRIYIEHTMQHSPKGASEMDPFGAHPMIMPYLLFEWGKGKYELADILHTRAETKGEVWVFVIRPAARMRTPIRPMHDKVETLVLAGSPERIQPRSNGLTRTQPGSGRSSATKAAKSPSR